MKNSIRTSTLTLLLSVASLGALAQAQPDTNNGAKADNPVNRAPRRLRPDANATPEERMKWAVKRMYATAGADDATQEILATFTQKEPKARQDLAQKGQPLQEALRAGVLPDAQIAALLNTYQVALEDEKTRRTKAIADLEKVVDFKKSPKIEAALTLAGLIGDGPTMAGGLIGRGMMIGRGAQRPERGQNGRANGNARRNRQNVPAQGV